MNRDDYTPNNTDYSNNPNLYGQGYADQTCMDYSNQSMSGNGFQPSQSGTAYEQSGGVNAYTQSQNSYYNQFSQDSYFDQSATNAVNGMTGNYQDQSYGQNGYYNSYNDQYTDYTNQGYGDNMYMAGQQGFGPVYGGINEKPKKTKKPVVIALILAVVAGIGVGSYFIFFRPGGIASKSTIETCAFCLEENVPCTKESYAVEGETSKTTGWLCADCAKNNRVYQMAIAECSYCAQTLACFNYEVTYDGETEEGYFCDDCDDIFKGIVPLIGGSMKKLTK